MFFISIEIFVQSNFSIAITSSSLNTHSYQGVISGVTIYSQSIIFLTNGDSNFGISANKSISTLPSFLLSTLFSKKSFDFFI